MLDSTLARDPVLKSSFRAVRCLESSPTARSAIPLKGRHAARGERTRCEGRHLLRPRARIRMCCKKLWAVCTSANLVSVACPVLSPLSGCVVNSHQEGLLLPASSCWGAEAVKHPSWPCSFNLISSTIPASRIPVQESTAGSIPSVLSTPGSLHGHKRPRGWLQVDFSSRVLTLI